MATKSIYLRDEEISLILDSMMTQIKAIKKQAHPKPTTQHREALRRLKELYSRIFSMFVRTVYWT